ncbi:hypothetical protein Hamer_G007698, partial [Homarus americanus]
NRVGFRHKYGRILPKEMVGYRLRIRIPPQNRIGFCPRRRLDIAPENDRILLQQTVGFCPQRRRYDSDPKDGKIVPQKTVRFRTQYGGNPLQNTNSARENGKTPPKKTAGFRLRTRVRFRPRIRYDSAQGDGRISLQKTVGFCVSR